MKIGILIKLNNRGNMKTLRVFLITTVLLILTVIGNAQDYVSKTASLDKFKIGVNFVNTEFDLSPVDQVEYIQGISATLDAKIVSQKENKGFRLGGKFYYKRDNFNFPTDTYSFGPVVSYRFSVFEPYGHALFGLNTVYNGAPKNFTRIYGAGLDINLGYVFIKPIEINYQKQENFLPGSNQFFSSGIGVRF